MYGEKKSLWAAGVPFILLVLSISACVLSAFVGDFTGINSGVLIGAAALFFAWLVGAAMIMFDQTRHHTH